MPTTSKATSAKSSTRKAPAAAVKTPVRKPAEPAAKRAATPAKAGTATPRRSQGTRIDPEKRRHYVEVAAYYIAQRRGFINGDETLDWLAAEQEIDRLLLENALSA